MLEGLSRTGYQSLQCYAVSDGQKKLLSIFYLNRLTIIWYYIGILGLRALQSATAGFSAAGCLACTNGRDNYYVFTDYLGSTFMLFSQTNGSVTTYNSLESSGTIGQAIALIIGAGVAIYEGGSLVEEQRSKTIENGTYIPYDFPVEPGLKRKRKGTQNGKSQ